MKTPAKYKNMEFRGLLLELVKLFNPQVYVELGVKKGYTFKAIAPHVKLAVGVDIKTFKFNKEQLFKDAGFMADNPDCEIVFHKMTTEEFATKEWPKRETLIDFLFIDADHKSESILKDLSMMERYLMPYSGLVFLHDTFPTKKELLEEGYCFDAWQAAHFIRQELHDFEIVTLPGPWAGLSILRYAPGDWHGWMHIDRRKET